jgi:ribonuclease HI
MNGPVQVATDGACLGNPGPGGWAWTTGLTDARGGQQVTTNQEMELRAILEALRAHRDQAIVILTDSQYAIDCVTTWLPGWRRRGWRTSARRPVKHQPIIEAIAAELDRRTVQLVKGPRPRRASAQRARRPARSRHGSPGSTWPAITAVGAHRGTANENRTWLWLGGGFRPRG